jgi:hypothetical protein
MTFGGRRPVYRWIRRFGVALMVSFATSLGVASLLRAAALDVPPALQASLLLKVITFDRLFAARAEVEVTVGIAYQSGNRASTVAKEDIAAALRNARVASPDRLVRVVPIDLDKESVATALGRENLYVLYVAPLRAVDIGDLAAATRKARVTTFTGTGDYVSQGLAVGVRLEGDRPRLLINVQQAKLEGADFSAELLKLAKVVK